MRFSLKAAAARALAPALLSIMAFAGVAMADDNPWAEGREWMSVRAGFARNASEGAGNGGAGYGIGVSHFLKPYRISDMKLAGRRPLGFLRWTFFKNMSLGITANHDVASRFGGASEVDIPVTVELVRHLRLKTGPRPYIGAGAGRWLRKAYRTGDDFTQVDMGYYVTTGMNAVVAENHLLGFDVRMARLGADNDPANPVFGVGSSEATRWSFKIQYSLAN